MSVVIAGGRGFVGRHVHEALKHKYKVSIVTRSPKKTQEISWNDIGRHGLPNDCEAVVGLQGEAVLQPFHRFDDARRSLLRSSRIETTRTLVDLVNKSPQVKCFVSMSGVGYYPPSQTAQYDESWRPRDTTNNGNKPDFVRQLSINWEDAARNVKIARSIILRSGVVLGPDGGILKSMYPSFWLGLGSTFGEGSQWFPWIHVKDLARLISYSVSCPDAMKAGGIYNAVVPSESITNQQFCKAFAKSFTPSRPLVLSTPAFVFKLMFGDELAKSMVLSGQRVRCNRLLTECADFQFEFANIDEACNSMH